MQGMGRVPARYFGSRAGRWISKYRQPQVPQIQAPETQYYQPTTWWGKIYNYFNPSRRLEKRPYTAEQAARARGIGAEQLEKNIEERLLINEMKEGIKTLDIAKSENEAGYALAKGTYNMIQNWIKNGIVRPTPDRMERASKALETMKVSEKNIQEINKLKGELIEDLKKLKE